MKMKFSVCFISLIAIYILPKTYSQVTKADVGCSGCSYFAATQEICNAPPVPISDFPQECTSFFYFDVEVDCSSNIGFGDNSISNDEYLKCLIKSGKPVFLYYGHQNVSEWLKAISCNSQDGGLKAKYEMAKLTSFLTPYKEIKGLVLEGLTYMKNVTDTAGFTNNLIIYIDEMKKSFPDYAIGLEIFGKSFVDYKNQQNSPEWIDFKLLDANIDFYIINVYQLNECTKEFKVGGTCPINGSAVYTIDLINGYVQQLGVPQQKIHFMYRTEATAIDPNLDTCNTTNSKEFNLKMLC